jgi:hypothetical protein
VLDAIPEIKTPLGTHRLRLITGLVTAAAAYVCVTGEYNGPLAQKEHVFSGVRPVAPLRRERLRCLQHALTLALAAVKGAARGLGSSRREAGSRGGEKKTTLSSASVATLRRRVSCGSTWASGAL